MAVEMGVERESAPPTGWRSWRLHVALAGVLLVAVTAWVGLDGQLFVDEAAVHAQVELLEERGTWTTDRPFADRDPDGLTVPMDNSDVIGDEFAPFLKHPLAVALNRAADRVGGRLGMRLLAVAGALGAAAFAGAFAARRRPALAVPTVWCTAVLSPLVFDSQLVVSHTMAAAVTAGLVYTVLDVSNRARLPLLFAACLIGPQIRTEVLLLAAAFAAISVARPVLRMGSARIGDAVAMLGGAVAAYVLEPVWINRLVDGNASLFAIGAEARGGVGGAVRAAELVLVSPSYQAGDLADLSLLAAVIALALGTGLLAAGRRDLAGPVLLVAVVTSVVVPFAPALTPGILLAFPLVTVLVVLVRRTWPTLDGDERFLVVSAAAFAAAILVTQYETGGGIEWGWRYFAIALPAVSYVAVVAVAELLADLDAATRRRYVVAVLAVSLLVPISGLRELRSILDKTDRLQDQLAVLTDDADRIVMSRWLLGRSMWQLSIGGRVADASDDNVTEVIAWAADEGDETVVLVSPSGEDLPQPLSGYRIAGSTELSGYGLTATRLVRT